MKLHQLNEVALTERQAWNLIMKIIGEARMKDSRIDDVGQKNEVTHKIGQRVHEFDIGDMVFQVIRVDPTGS